MKLALIAGPAVFVNVVDIASLNLYFFNVVIPSKCVDHLGLHIYCREEAKLVWHGAFVVNVLVYVLETIASHPAK